MEPEPDQRAERRRSSPISRASPTARCRPTVAPRSRRAWPRRRSSRASSSARASPWTRCAARPTPAPRRGCARSVDRRRGAGRAAGGGRRRVAHRRRDRGRRVRGPRPDPGAAGRILGRARASPTPRRSRRSRRPRPRPARVPGTPQLLRAEVDDVPFPNYAAKFGWKPVGARQDDPSGRGATTVYYEKGGRTIAYTIVSGDALDPPSDARSTTRGGVEYRTLPRRRPNGRHVGARRPHVRALRQGGAARGAPHARRLARQGRDPLLGRDDREAQRGRGGALVLLHCAKSVGPLSVERASDPGGCPPSEVAEAPGAGHCAGFDATAS